MQDDGQDLDLRAQLRAAGLRVTAPRLAVLNAVTAQPHSDADSVAAQVRQQLGSVSTQAVYDVLKACVSAGLLRRIEPAGSPARFETRTGDNHHHLVCRSCGKVVDVDCVVGQAPCLEPSDHHGFEIDEAEVVFWGRCNDCLKSSAESGIVSDAVSQNHDAAR
ncbi:transcriptional repressor [Rhodococcus sp. ACPA4]|uniref:Fur family ferric uptake transcriptional regulator n=2 Tax=Nocardiaceae TaxID=85025 RepID=A0A652YQK6_NOCGL|nr:MULTISPECIES: Fur family transcriptional regulator [Rhodococcus]NMD62630.1 transcriptional repressor [Nocardia globerula]MCE4265920.1 transcriptional repressor [Rhodococcus globerulus]MDV6270167.1 Fur family transcriptional regulator [Rhodococcus globerulus]MDV8065956.1 Fur family transcriptional regulator [Rhodococcus sp. IEGM 1366]PBC44067.1 transcriptional repressor [Rhodococcus sp. ACPA4]